MGADEGATIETLTAYRKVFVSHIESRRGRVVDAKGDAILAEFASVVAAVNSAVEIQGEVAEQNADLPDDRRMDFRIGINLGDVVVKDEVIYGDGVNIAARLESLAEPGGICISRPVYDQVESKLNLEYEYLGEQQVKNIAKPVRAYGVALTSMNIASPELPSEPPSAASLLPGNFSLELPDQPSISRSWGGPITSADDMRRRLKRTKGRLRGMPIPSEPASAWPERTCPQGGRRRPGPRRERSSKSIPDFPCKVSSTDCPKRTGRCVTP